MTIIRYETEIGAIKRDAPIIFLAGPTVRGHQTYLGDSWRMEAITLFDKHGFSGTLILPEFSNKFESDKGRYDLPVWENAGMELANTILFWVPRTRELIGLTTNFELGYWMARERKKIVYGRPDDAYRIDYLDILWKLDADRYRPFLEPERLPNDEICNTLESTIIKAIKQSNICFFSQCGCH